jgi:hypothetical protein
MEMGKLFLKEEVRQGKVILLEFIGGQWGLCK